jgi:hypothetical protein
VRALSTLPLLFLLTGCSALFNIEAGYAHAIAKNPEQATGALNANAGIGTASNDGVGVGGGAMLRAKVGPNVQQFALGPMMYVGSSLAGGREGPVQLAVMGGFHLLQMDNVHTTTTGDNFSFGMLSPVAEVMFFLRPAWMTFSVAGEYDLRFSSIPNTGYLSFLIGVGGFGASGSGLR